MPGTPSLTAAGSKRQGRVSSFNLLLLFLAFLAPWRFVSSLRSKDCRGAAVRGTVHVRWNRLIPARRCSHVPPSFRRACRRPAVHVRRLEPDKSAGEGGRTAEDRPHRRLDPHGLCAAGGETV